MQNPTSAFQYQPTSQELARQNYVVALKRFVNGTVEGTVRSTYERRIKPDWIRRRGAPPQDRHELNDPLRAEATFKQWAAMVYFSQGMMWEAIEDTVQHEAPRLAREFERIAASADKLGSLHLNPDLEIPWPIAEHEIHRQPDGYAFDRGGADLTAGLRGYGASVIYGSGKGHSGAGTDARGQFIVAGVKQRFGDLKPKRVLDMGCGIGLTTQAFPKAFPDAEIHAIDVAASGLRFGHALAESNGLAIHFHQQDAAATHFEDQSFDLIVSNILFHETSTSKLPAIFEECHRLLAPGGAMLHSDVATQSNYLPIVDQVLTHWQTKHNGEPFWTQFADLDVKSILCQAGFAPDKVYAEHVAKPGAPGHWFVFGASR